MIPNQGTSLSSAIEKAIETVKKDQNKYKVVLLISDGEDHEGNAIKFSNQANELGIDIHTIGIGSDLGVWFLSDRVIMMLRIIKEIKREVNNLGFE